mmetsp:Transcript_81346/g.126906  ORF Transcript_81346/g.126906 Transcript_81346/m.126906 type:complete len:91 (-) Transcript_81346:70-342(-)
MVAWARDGFPADASLLGELLQDAQRHNMNQLCGGLPKSGRRPPFHRDGPQPLRGLRQFIAECEPASAVMMCMLIGVMLWYLLHAEFGVLR